MEILSTAEKIKRARIYKGVTLKELCGEKISISKMSCIENGKIKADEEILKYISKILCVDYDYLVQDVYDQIVENVSLIEKKQISYDDMEDIIKYNLEYSLINSFNDLSFKLTHKLFTIYLKERKIESIHLLISDYYDLFQKCNSIKNQAIYYEDMANFFASIAEYTEAINYYSKVREIIEHIGLKDKNKYVYICLYEGECLSKTGNNKKAYDVLTLGLEYIDYLYSDLDKANYFHLYGMMNIIIKNKEANKYIEMSYKLLGQNNEKIATFKMNSGKYKYITGENINALKDIEEAIELLKKENRETYTTLLLECIEILYENNELEKVEEYIDNALNLAIDVNDNMLVEKAYYYKGMLYQKRSMYLQAEMYMNLSTDTLLRFANNEQRYKRYNEMAELYYNLGELKESIKYFVLAVNLEKKI